MPDTSEELSAAQVRTEYVRLMEMLTESHFRRISVLEDEKSSLRSQKRALKQYVQELLEEQRKLESRHREYCAALSRNIELVRQYAPCPVLPLDVLGNIANFLAGQNAFATLAALCQTGKLVKAECESALWETVVWNKDLMQQWEDGRRNKSYPNGFKHIRFLIIDLPDWQHLQSDIDARFSAFPNLRIYIKKLLDPRGDRPAYPLDDAEWPRYIAEVHFQLPSTMATLFSLLRCNLSWNLKDESQTQSRITAVNSVAVGYEAYVTRGSGAEEDVFRPQVRGLGNIQIECEDVEDPPQKKNISIEALVQLVLPYPDPPYNPGDHMLVISVDKFSDIKAWLQHLPLWATRDPNLYFSFAVDELGDITAERFIETAEDLLQIYERLWPTLYNSHPSDQDQRDFLDLTVMGSTSRVPGRTVFLRYEAILAKWMNPRGINFRVDAYSEPTAADDMGSPATVRDEVYLADLGRRLPLLQAMRYAVADDDSDDDVDDDSDDDADMEHSVYFVFFGCLEAFPVIYGDIHGLEPYQVGLCFLPILVGAGIAVLASLPFAVHYAKEARLGRSPPPESRLVPLIIGGLILPVSLFWLGWVGGYSTTSIWASVFSGLGLGFSTVFIFIGTYQMLIDTYEANASSALAANVLVRYLCAGGAVMAARPMFSNVQPQWACTLLGCVAVAMVPFSFLFYVKGESFRRRSRYAPHDK